MIAAITATVPYLGSERFGAWMTIASLAAMLSFLDLGIGNALTNRVAQATNTGESQSLTRVITGGLSTLLILCLLLAVGLTLIAMALPLATIMKIRTPAVANEVGQAAVVFALLFSASTFTNGISRVFSGLQRGFEMHIAAALGSAASLLGLYVAANAKANIPVLLVCTMLGPILANLFLLARLQKLGQFSPAQSVFAISTEYPILLRHGSLFFLLQIGTMVGWGADSLIISNTAGAASVAAFAIVQRMTLLISQPLAMLNAPLWAAYADADSRGEKTFIRQTFKHSLRITLMASTVGALLLVLAGEDIARMWTQNHVQPENWLLVAMAIWVILESTGNSLGVFLNGVGVVRQQVWVVISFVLLAIPMKYWLGSNYGAAGVVMAGVVAYLLTTVSGYGFIFRKNLSEKINE